MTLYRMHSPYAGHYTTWGHPVPACPEHRQAEVKVTETAKPASRTRSIVEWRCSECTILLLRYEVVMGSGVDDMVDLGTVEEIVVF